MAAPCHSIKVVSNRTGLSPHVIRIWEKRYGVVAPERTGTNRRLYSDEEIERLSLLREAISYGHSIGNIAKLSGDRLRQLIEETAGARGKVAGDRSGSDSGRLDLQSRCLAAIRSFDGRGLDAALVEGLMKLGHQALLRKVIAPLTQTLGDLWREGELTAAHEHFASSLIRVFLGEHSKPFALATSAPHLVVATPVGQLHELGAIMAGAAASNVGWRVAYLGSSLPAAEMAAVAIQHKARAVALSLVYPEDDPGLPEELMKLRRMLPAEIKILAGGRAVESYRSALQKVGAIIVTELHDLYRVLDELRVGAKA